MKKSFLLLCMLILLSITELSKAQITWDSTTLNNNNITSNVTLYSNVRYILKGFVYVKEPAILTIQPGTVIYGDKTTTGTLIIERGAKIIADGTAQHPIIFTSRLPAGQRGPGDWGGIILLGRAKINTVSGADTMAIEGLPPYVQPAYFGGNNDNDNSGILRYVRIEFPGINLTGTSGNEINGLTMGGVGKGTIIEYVQVSYCGDDAFEWFGGTVNGRYLIAYKNVDDDFDQDNGFRGKLQFLLGVRDSNIADVSGSNGYEIDNNANNPFNYNTPRTQSFSSNVTIVGPKRDTGTVVNPNFKRAMHLRRNMLSSFYNSIYMGYPDAILFDGIGVSNACLGDTIQIRNCVFAGCPGGFKKTTDASPSFNPTNWINTSSFQNTVYTLNSQVQLTNPYGYENNANFLPLPGSPVLTGASFSNPNLSDPFFTQVSFRGAFGTVNWAAGWANFDPQNYNISVKKISSTVPEEYTLNQNYPNPFNPTTKISFAVPKTSLVTLKVYDITGKEVATLLLNENLQAGTYEYEFNASKLSSGIYFYSLITDEFAQTKKMLLVK